MAVRSGFFYRYKQITVVLSPLGLLQSQSLLDVVVTEDLRVFVSSYVLCTQVLFTGVFSSAHISDWQLQKRHIHLVGFGGGLESNRGRASLSHTHGLSAENKALCSWPCEHVCQRKAGGLPTLGLTIPEKTQEFSRLFDWAGQPHKSQRRVLVAVRTAERRPVKASLTASNGVEVKNGDIDFIFF